MNPSVNSSTIYLDFNATTPVDPRVADSMRPYLMEHFGNPSSGHSYGRATRAAIDQARAKVAKLLQASPAEIIFTSGGTEANNHAIIGAAVSRADKGNHIVTSIVEHPAVTAVCQYLETRGFTTTYVGVDKFGAVDPQEMIDAMTDRTVLVSLMHANNEVGTLQPVAEVAAAARSRGILSHTDCAQSLGKVPATLPDLGVDMISVASHKIYGPKGIGALCLREGTVLPNLMHGAGHEEGRRPGTENLLGIVGLGTACSLVAEDLDHEITHLATLRNRLQDRLLEEFSSARVNGHLDKRLPNTLSISFPDAAAADIMAAMPEVLVSAGAACHDGGAVFSHVLSAMGVEMAYARGTLRISLGRMTTEDDVERGGGAIIRAVKKVRGGS